MKILYTSVYRDGTGYGNAAISNIKAANSVGIDVVCRPFTLTGPKIKRKFNQDDEISKLESKNLDGITHIIQHTLPHLFQYKNGIKNIGYFDWETTNFSQSNWPSCCNIMDEIWVPSTQNKQACINSGVKKPIKIVPHAIDDTLQTKDIKKLNIPEIKNKLVFYTIGEFKRRKNFIATIRAYYHTFTCKDDVVLLIKTNDSNSVKKMIEDTKKAMHNFTKVNYYPMIIILKNDMTYDEILSLHKTGNIFILLSHGEAWSLPTHDAMFFGNPVILSDWGSSPDLCCDEFIFDPLLNKFSSVKPKCGWLVPGVLSPCFGEMESFPDLYTGKELWFDPDISRASEYMREAYNLYYDNITKSVNNSFKFMSDQSRERALKFNLKNVGNIIKESL